MPEYLSLFAYADPGGFKFGDENSELVQFEAENKAAARASCLLVSRIVSAPLRGCEPDGWGLPGCVRARRAPRNGSILYPRPGT